MGKNVTLFLLIIILMPFVSAIICNPNLPNGCPSEPIAITSPIIPNGTSANHSLTSDYSYDSDKLDGYDSSYFYPYDNPEGFITNGDEIDPIWTADKPNYRTLTNYSFPYVLTYSVKIPYGSYADIVPFYIDLSNLYWAGGLNFTYLVDGGDNINIKPFGTPTSLNLSGFRKIYFNNITASNFYGNWNGSIDYPTKNQVNISYLQKNGSNEDTNLSIGAFNFVSTGNWNNFTGAVTNRLTMRGANSLITSEVISGNGTNINITAKSGTAGTGNGGNISFKGGNTGPTTATTANAGSLIFTGGNGVGGNGRGGSLYFISGDGAGGGNAGIVQIGTGVSATLSGNILINTGTAQATSGNINITTGGASGGSGNVFISTGSSFGNSAGINITTGNATNGASGDIDFITSLAGGTGGAINFYPETELVASVLGDKSGFRLLSNKKLYLGTSSQASIVYNGSDLVYNSKEVGNGNHWFFGFVRFRSNVVALGGLSIFEGLDVLSGQTNLTNTSITGWINQTGGNATLNGIYGEMWNKSDDGFETVDLVTVDTYVRVTNYNTTASHLNGFSYNGGNLTAQISGRYKVEAKIGVVTGGVGGENGMKIFVNDVGQNECYDHEHTSGDPIGFIATCIVSLNAGDYINVRFDDHQNPVTDLILLNANVNIVRWGNL